MYLIKGFFIYKKTIKKQKICYPYGCERLEEGVHMDYYTFSDYVLSVVIASIASFIGVSFIIKVNVNKKSRNKIRIVSLVFGMMIYYAFLNSYFSDIRSSVNWVFIVLVILFSSGAVYLAINTITNKEVSFRRLVVGALIFASCISLVNLIDIRTEMIAQNLKMNLWLFISANLLLLGNTIATFRFIRQLRKLGKVKISWLIYGSIAIGLAFSSIRFTLFSSITLFSNVDLFGYQGIPLLNFFYNDHTLLPLAINIFGLVFLELFPNFVSDVYSERQRELIYQNKYQYEALFENQAVAILSLNEKGKITKVNEIAKKMTGFDAEELEGLACFSELIHETQKENFIHLLTIAFHGESQMFETKLVTKLQTPVDVQITLLPIFLEEKLTHINIFAKDISEIAEAREEIHYMAYHDSLTLLPNRRFFVEELNRQIAKSHSQSKMAVCFLDLDRFKLVNDTLGHQAGDQLLKIVADRFRNTVDQDVVIARLGGDEFTFLFPNIVENEKFKKQLEEILIQIQTPFLLENQDQEFHVTGSLGIAIYPQDSQSCDNLMKFADMAMYSAKEHGKNRYVFYEDYLSEKNFEESLLEADV